MIYRGKVYRGAYVIIVVQKATRYSDYRLSNARGACVLIGEGTNMS